MNRTINRRYVAVATTDNLKHRFFYPVRFWRDGHLPVWLRYLFLREFERHLSNRLLSIPLLGVSTRHSNNQDAISIKSGVKQLNLRTFCGVRAGGTQSQCSAEPISIPVAFGLSCVKFDISPATGLFVLCRIIRSLFFAIELEGVPSGGWMWCYILLNGIG